MMYFCESCEAVMDTQGRCPRCGGKKVRPIEANDPIFLTEMDISWSGTLADIFREEGIPFRMRSMLGTARATYLGKLADIEEFFVRWADYDRAQQFVQLLTTELIEPDAAGAFDVEPPDDEYEDYDPDEEPEDPTPEQQHRRPRRRT